MNRKKVLIIGSAGAIRGITLYGRQVLCLNNIYYNIELKVVNDE